MILSVNKQLEKQDARERAAREAAAASESIAIASIAEADGYHQSTTDTSEFNYTTPDE